MSSVSRADLMLTFRANPQQLAVALGVEEARRILGDKAGGRVGETTQITTQETTPITTQKTTLIATRNTTEKILAVLQKNPRASRTEIAEELGDITENGVKYHLAKLSAEGRIKRIGAARGGYWKIRGNPK